MGDGAPPVPPRVPLAGSVGGLGPGLGGPGLGGPAGYGAFGGYSAPGGYGAYASPYGGSPFGGGGFGLGPGYGGVYGGGLAAAGPGLGAGSGPEWTLSRLAEERTAGAWESLDSVVTAVSSVSHLIESSAAAVHNSFRAVVGVADQVGRLKALFSSLFLSLNLLRFARWLFRRLMAVLGLARPEAGQGGLGGAWAVAGGPPVPAPGPETPKWSSLLFLLVSVGAPWLLYRGSSYLLRSAEEGDRWRRAEGPHYTATALFDFTAAREGELSLRKGQTILVAPKELQPRLRGWLLAAPQPSAAVDPLGGPSQAPGPDLPAPPQGIVPINYVRITARHPANSSQPPHSNIRDAL